VPDVGQGDDKNDANLEEPSEKTDWAETGCPKTWTRELERRTIEQLRDDNQKECEQASVFGRVAHETRTS